MFSSFTLESILAIAFGRVVNTQRGESDELSKSIDVLFGGFIDGQLEKIILFHSKIYIVVYVPHFTVKDSLHG